MNAAILLIGGKGTRFLDPTTPKQFQSLSGKPVFLYALEILLKSGLFEQILLPCHPDWIEPLEWELKKLSPMICLLEGGQTRQESVYKALKHLDSKVKKVVVHDGARPFMTQKMVEELLDALDLFGAAGTYIASSDTIGTTDGATILQIPKRASMVRGQTPQAFQTAVLKAAHLAAIEASIHDATCDISLALRLGVEVKKVEGSETNIKITTALDLYIAEQLLRITHAPLAPKPFDSLKNKRFALFGASGGIGSALQKELEKEEAVVLSLSRTSTPLSIDFNHLNEIPALCKQLEPLDGCFFAAGVLTKSSFQDLPLNKALEMIQVNFTSLILLLQHLPLKKGATCLLIASSSYYRGRKELAVYSATKAASVNLLQGFAEERPDLNIQIFCPKRTDTPLRQQNFPNEDKSLLLDPSTVATQIMEHLKAPTCSPEIINIHKS